MGDRMSDKNTSLVGPIVAGAVVAAVGSPVGGYPVAMLLGAGTFALLAWLRSR